MEENPINMKQAILDNITDLVRNLTYYDRKNDEELTAEDLENALASGEITLDEMVDHFRQCLENPFA